ncbi:MAG: hypothetical protein HY231_10705 [Acidobacteria bacterium]|nr:hypothetical protein [Acidobacteriota bacterium]
MVKNDEPVYEDALGYYSLVKRIGHRILRCAPPYVIGVCGSWGAGKTSFLRMLQAYLGGAVERADGGVKKLSPTEHQQWFVEAYDEFKAVKEQKKIELVWFNPWQHQFESSPLVALLNEIRQHFSIKHKLFNQAGKLTDVTIHATLNSMTEIAKDLKIPLPSARTVMERGREYESEHFSSALGSQRFRDFFESAIKTITGKDGLLVIFIDDLDRCEGEVSYRLLESLKLYLNASNCVYILGLDQQHLESTIAKALSGEKETWRFRPLARDYLSKMFQNIFLLPVPRQTHTYIEQLLDFADADFQSCLTDLFGFKAADRQSLVAVLNENLPHNPRKIKSFIASWKLYLDALSPLPAAEKLDWRLTLVLQYLAQFEEPLFRRIEIAPAFYNDELVNYCRHGYSAHPLFDGLELPYGMQINTPENDPSGGFDSPIPSGTEATSEPGGVAKKDEPKRLPEPRIFWVSRLVKQLMSERGDKLNEEFILQHLLHAGGK